MPQAAIKREFTAAELETRYPDRMRQVRSEYQHCAFEPLLLAIATMSVNDFAARLKATTHTEMVTSHIYQALRKILHNDHTEDMYQVADGEPNYFLLRLAMHFRCKPSDIVPESEDVLMTRRDAALKRTLSPHCPPNLSHFIAHFPSMEDFYRALGKTRIAQKKGLEELKRELELVISGAATGYSATYEKGDLVQAIDQMPQKEDWDPIPNPYYDSPEYRAKKVREECPKLPDTVVEAIARHRDLYGFIDAVMASAQTGGEYDRSFSYADRLKEMIGKKGRAYQVGGNPITIASAIARYLGKDMESVFPARDFGGVVPKRALKTELCDRDKPRRPTGKPFRLAAGSMPADFSDLVAHYQDKGGFAALVALLPPKLQVAAHELRHFAENGGWVTDKRGAYMPAPLAAHYLVKWHSPKKDRQTLPIQDLFPAPALG